MQLVFSFLYCIHNFVTASFFFTNFYNYPHSIPPISFHFSHFVLNAFTISWLLLLFFSTVIIIHLQNHQHAFSFQFFFFHLQFCHYFFFTNCHNYPHSIPPMCIQFSHFFLAIAISLLLLFSLFVTNFHIQYHQCAFSFYNFFIACFWACVPLVRKVEKTYCFDLSSSSNKFQIVTSEAKVGI